MKRLVVFLMLLGMFAAIGVAGPAERFTKVDVVSVGATGNQLFMPAFLGAGFRPDKLTLHSWGTSGTSACTVTVYIPTGPATAIDSVTLIQNRGGNYETPSPLYYYGPCSDTVRVSTGANSHIRVFAYGW